jgi:hypothetical protein
MTSKKWLTGFIALNSIIQLSLMVMLWTSLPAVLDYLKVQNCDGAHIFETYFISAIMIIAPAGFLAINWLNKNKNEGIVLARFIGITMTIAAINVGLSLHRVDLAAMDLARGIPITILAFMQKTS